MRAKPTQLRIEYKLILGGQVFEMPPLELPPEVLAALQKLTHTANRPALGPGNSRRFALHKGQGAWRLIYDGELAVFVDRAGMDFVDYLLKHPGEAIHSLALLARVQGEALVQQRSAALDDADATRHYLREMSRLRAVLDSDDTSELEKKVAEEELAQLEASGVCLHHHTIDEAFKAARSVRQAIRRVCSSLAEARDEQHRPHPVLTAFAAHLQKHLLVPSQPGSVPSGHLVYEPPEGVVWG